MNKLLPIILAFFLAGCSSLPTELAPETGTVVLQGEKSVGQTFVADFDGLEGIKINQNPGSNPLKSVRVILKARPDETSILAENLLEISPRDQGYVSLSFERQPDSNQQNYYLSIGAESLGRLDLTTLPGEGYLDGARYQNGLPTDSQLDFVLVYDPWLLTWGLIQEGVGVLGILLAIGLIFVLPGWAILGIFWTKDQGMQPELKIPLAAGIGLALYPVVLLWADLVGIRVGPWIAWLIPGIAAAVIVIRRRSFKLEWHRAMISDKRLLIAGLGLVIAFHRFWPIRGLETGMWGDSVHHTLITQLLVDQGGLFNSWRPYAELSTFTYHFGFHTSAALLHWTTGIPVIRSVLVMGQVWNIFAILALYPIVVRWSRSHWAGFAVVLVVGFLSPLPMGYLNWGRYTQLTGQVILPVFMYYSWVWLESMGKEKRPIILLSLLLAGLGLTHYRVLIFAVLFLLAYLLGTIRRGDFGRTAVNIILIGTGAGLIFFPWIFQMLAGKLFQIITTKVTLPTQAVQRWVARENSIGPLTRYLPGWLWASGILLSVWGWLKKPRLFRVLTLWVLLVLIAANPHWVGISGTGLIVNFTVFIAIYLFIAMPGAIGFGLVEREITQKNPFRQNQGAARLVLKLGLPVVVVLLLLIPGRERWAEIQEADHALVTRPDTLAMEWIEKKLPDDSVLYVQGFSAYGGSLIAGSDAGWWLTYLSGKRSTLPPITYGSERGYADGYLQSINELYRIILDNESNFQNLRDIYIDAGITHIFIGQLHGSVNSKSPISDPAALAEFFPPVYHQDRVWILKVE